MFYLKLEKCNDEGTISIRLTHVLDFDVINYNSAHGNVYMGEGNF